MRFSCLLLLGALGTLVSCHKADLPEPVAPATRAQLLTAQKWRVQSSVLEADGYADVDIYALSLPCSRDDYMEFRTPSLYLYSAGTTKCSPADPQTELGNWALAANDTQLVINSAGSTDTYTVAGLTDKELKLVLQVPQSTGAAATLRITYAAW